MRARAPSTVRVSDRDAGGSEMTTVAKTNPRSECPPVSPILQMGQPTMQSMTVALQFDPTWRFTSPGPIPGPVVYTFQELIKKIAGQGDTWTIVERFKDHFSGGMGRSSSLSWAWSDLHDSMHRAGDNAPLFIEAFCKEVAPIATHPASVCLTSPSSMASWPSIWPAMNSGRPA
jgi:hypothetical protein